MEEEAVRFAGSERCMKREDLRTKALASYSSYPFLPDRGASAPCRVLEGSGS